MMLVIALAVTCANLNLRPNKVQAAEVDTVTNLSVTSYCDWTGKYLIYFTAPTTAEGYKVFVDDATEPVATITGSGDYVTNEQLSQITPGEHQMRVAAYVTVDGVEVLSDKVSKKFTKSDTTGTFTDIPQIYIKSGSITGDYREENDVSVTVIDQDGGSKGQACVDDTGSHPNAASIKKYADIVDTKCNIKVRGNTTASQPKKPWNIKFSGKTSVLGLPKGKKWNLLANAMDKSLMRDTLSYNFGLENGVRYTSQSRYVDVYLNGDYKGNYQLCEPVEAKSNRVETDAYNAENDDILLEVGTRYEAGVDHFTTDVLGQTFDVNDPKKGDDLTDEQVDAKIQRARTFLNQFESVLKNNGNDLYEISRYIDIDTFVDFYIANELFKNVDFNFSSTRFYIKDNKLYAGPMWDLDLSSGNAKSSNYPDYYVDGDSAKGFRCRNFKYYNRLFRNAEFEALVKKRYYDLQFQIQNLYRNDSVAVNSINNLIETYGNSFARNYMSKDLKGAGWRVNQDDGYSYAAESGWQTWMDPIDFLRDWLTRRNNWICQEWDIDMAQAYEDSREWSENPTTAAPTTARPTVETTTPGPQSINFTRAERVDKEYNGTTRYAIFANWNKVDGAVGYKSYINEETDNAKAKAANGWIWSDTGSFGSGDTWVDNVYRTKNNTILDDNTTYTLIVVAYNEVGMEIARGSVMLLGKGQTAPAPTTLAPTTLAPTTLAPTTKAPTTKAPTDEPTKDQTVNPTDKKPTVKPSGGTKYSNVPGRATVIKAKKSAKKIKVTLKKLNRVSGYQIAIYKSKKNAKKNKKAIVKRYTITLNTKIKSKKFAKIKKLYVRARAYAIITGKVYFGRWSAIKKAK